MTFRTSKKNTETVRPEFGFVILCPERNLGGLNNTVNSIKSNFPECSYVCAVGDDVQKGELSEMIGICNTVKAGNTITSLINVGMKHSDAEWNVIVFSGSWLNTNLINKAKTFIKSDRDVLFPVVDFKCNFVDGSMNGIVLHRKMFEDAGDFPTGAMQKAGVSDIEMAKLFWAIEAIEKGAIFKGIVGMRVC
jgi:hypothetical protein